MKMNCGKSTDKKKTQKSKKEMNEIIWESAMDELYYNHLLSLLFSYGSRSEENQEKNKIKKYII